MITLIPTELAEQTGIAMVSELPDTHALSGLAGPGAAIVQPESTEEVSRLLGWANRQGLKVVPSGMGTKQDRGGRPTGCDIVLDMSRISGIIEHASGDMTTTVRAGTRLSDLQGVLAKAGQFLAIDPPVPGSVGGLIATGDSGPRRLRYGGVRDMLLGVTFVRADGTVARGGGKVVKNVAGYDLPKLLTGSLGTLGVIVEATFRLYPIPPASATIISKDPSVQEASRQAALVLTSGVVPTMLDYYAEGAEGVLAVRFETSPRGVRGQAERALSLLSASDQLQAEPESALWSVFDSIVRTDGDDTLARLVTTPTDLPRLLDATRRRANGGGARLLVRAHMGHGHALLRLSGPDEAVLDVLRAARAQAESHQSNLVVWRAPDKIRQQIDVWGDAGEGLPLMHKVKAQFDLKGTLNPGRFVGGI